MGQVAAKICGGAGPLDLLLKTYGDDIGRFIAIEKVKQFLDGQLGNVKNKVGQQSNSVLQQILGAIDTKKTQLGNTFQSYKQQINEKAPGGISSLQKIKGDSIENMLGYNEFLKKFDELKNTTTNKFNEQQKVVFNTIDQTGQEQKKILDTQKPKVPLYDDLSENQQKMVFKEGEKMFASQIQQQQDTIVKQLGDKLKPETYLASFKNLIPMSSIDGVFGSATSKFESMKGMLTGAGGLGNLAHSFGII